MAFFYPVLPLHAVLRENTPVLAASLLLSGLLFAYGASCAARGYFFEAYESSQVSYVLAGVLMGLMLATAVLEAQAWRSFGWRVLSQFNVDFRQGDARHRMRLWSAARLASALLLVQLASVVRAWGFGGRCR